MRFGQAQRFLLAKKKHFGVMGTLRATGNNAYAKVWREKQRGLWYF